MSASTFHLLRSLAWLRWRIALNALTRSGARDMLERLSRTAESVLPLAIVVMLLPLAVVLLALGGWSGWNLALDPALAAWPIQIARWGLLTLFFITVLSPVILATGQQAAGTIRLLLLPIPARVLYLAHSAGALADPWVFLSIPLLVGLSGGLGLNGRVAAALVTAIAGFGFLAALLGLAALASATLQLAVRNRRRAELLALGGMLLVLTISLLPSLVFTDEGGASPGNARHARHSFAVAGWIRATGTWLPSELYVSGTRHAAEGEFTAALSAAAAILGWAVVLHGLTWPLYQRLLQIPATTGAPRRATAGPLPAGRRLPLVSASVSAVALTFARLAYRTPRGRATIMMPVVMLIGFAAITVVRDTTIPFGPVTIGGGYSLGIFGVVIALISIGPLVFNQFAVDGAGLTLEFLAPISARALVYGKAVGGALIAAGPCALGIAAGAVTGGYSPLVWVLVVLGACSSYLLTAPAAAVLSTIFPRAVDLSTIGQGSNAHQVAGLLGFIAFVASCAPPAAAVLIGSRLLESDAAAALLLVAWLGVAAALSWVGFRIAERLLEERRENLAMVAQGR